MKKPLNILSLGAGVQSTALAWMGELGDIDIDFAIFADTQDEPDEIYTHIDNMQTQITTYPIYRVTKGKLSDTLTQSTYIDIPFFIKGKDGKIKMGRRQCTNQYKIQPVYRKTRELLGLRRHKRPKAKEYEDGIVVNMIMGITTDEALRMRHNKIKWIKNIYPFIDMDMTRQDVIKWLAEHGYSTPNKSACYYCPYHSQSVWKEMKKNDPVSFNKALAIEKMLPTNHYIHQKCVPLDQAVEQKEDQLDFSFVNECEGMCGV